MFFITIMNIYIIVAKKVLPTERMLGMPN